MTLVRSQSQTGFDRGVLGSESDSPAVGLLAKLGALAGDVKVSHSVFALPFALLAAFLAGAHVSRLPSVGAFALIVVCMVLARTVAMAINRWADAELDAVNPRAMGRAIPGGRLTGGFVLASAVVCGVGFVCATGLFWVFWGNAYPLALSLPVLVWLGGYSYAKRFTVLCHLWLGSALALSPLAAVIAIEPGYLGVVEPWVLAGMVACWVAGFDVIYALQDVGVDREVGTYSLPARLGVRRALWVSRAMHVAAAALLIGLWRVSGVLGVGFAVGVGIVTALLVVEHVLVWRSERHYLHIAFLTVNGVISVVLGSLGILDVVVAVVK